VAKKSMIARNKKRERLVEYYREKRAELKEIIRKPSTDYEVRMDAYKQLRKLPRDSSRTRIRNRCALTGRPRGVYTKFGLARIALRDKALSGQLPGVTKASW